MQISNSMCVLWLIRSYIHVHTPWSNFMQITECLCPLYPRVLSPNSVTQHLAVPSADPVYMRRLATTKQMTAFVWPSIVYKNSQDWRHILWQKYSSLWWLLKISLRFMSHKQYFAHDPIMKMHFCRCPWSKNLMLNFHTTDIYKKVHIYKKYHE